MSFAEKTSPAPAADRSAAVKRLSIADLVLLRIAADPATRSDLQRDLLALTTPTRSERAADGTAFRKAAEQAIGVLVANGSVTDVRGRLQATAKGRADSLALAPSTGATSDWSGVRRTLIAQAIGLPEPTSHHLKALDRLEGLAAVILQIRYGIDSHRVLSPTDLRAALAVVALERAFGEKIRTGLGRGSGLPGKAGRMLAGQLFATPRQFSSDGRLIVALASETIDAREPTLEGLSRAALRRLTVVADPAPPKISGRRSPQPDNDASPIAAGSPRVVAISPPGMAEFAGAVLEAARPIAQGWPGARKAFISLVWRAIRDARPDWGLSEAAFKGMLAEAHRTGSIALATADLKDRCDLAELEGSKILYKNTVWHFVRVDD